MKALTTISKRLNRMQRTRREERLFRAGWYDLSARCPDPAILIGGCGRSGTTLFRELLNRHSRLACGPETSMFGLPFDVNNIAPKWELDAAELAGKAEAAPNLIAFAEQFYNEFLQREGKKRWVDKTPNNVRVLPKVLTWFPNAKFIHVIRDGRDVACSLRNHPSAKLINGVVTPVKTTNPISFCAERWLRDTSLGLAFKNHPRCLEVKYEDLISDTEKEMRRVCAFISEKFEPAMLEPDPEAFKKRAKGSANNQNAVQPINTKSIGRWKRDLKAAERKTFVDVAGELLVATGYAPDHAWADEPVAAATDR